jgi:adenylate cyclase
MKMVRRKRRNSSDCPTALSGLGPSLVDSQLNRMLSSGRLRASPAQKALLRFVVQKTITGEASQIKAYTIATELFKRDSAFNQATDPIVSVQASRLRRALKDYYLTEGKSDPVRIEIPVGTFVPVFRQNFPSPLEGKTANKQVTARNTALGWPSVLVRPLENLTGDPNHDYLAAGFATELAMELSRYQDFRVLRQPPGKSGTIFSRTMTNFVIEGNLKKHRTRLKVSVQLFSRNTGVQLWAGSHYSPLDASNMMAFEEETASTVAAHIGGEHGVISLNLSKETRSKPPSELKSYEAMLRYYEFDLSFCPETYLAALEALESAVQLEEDCDQVCSMLGRLYAVNYSHEIFPRPEGMKEAMRLAQKGVTLNPENQRARAILAYCLILSGEIPAAKAEIDRALELNPQSLFFLDTIGYLMVLSGAFEEGVKQIKETMSRNPYYSLQAHDALCYDWLRQGEYERAYEETKNFRRPSNFWEPLLKAALLGLLGRIDEGNLAADELMLLKPNFQERGVVLMKHYVKFDEILDVLASGLRNVGLELD